MPRSVLVPNVKQLTDHYLRQQHGGNIVGFHGGRIQSGYGIGSIFKSLARIAISLFKRGAKAVGKRALKAATEVGQDVLEGKDVIKSAKSRGEQAVSNMAETATNKVMVGRGRKKRIKRADPGKTVIRAPTKKLKTSNKLDNYNPKWNDAMHKDSCACAKSELDLFSIPLTQIEMEKGFWEDIDPITSIAASDTIEFLCAANSGVYTDLASSYLHVKAKITAADAVSILNFSKDAKDSHLTSALFYKDKAGKMDSVNPLAEAANINTGLKERHAHTRQSRSVTMEGRIHSDLFAQDRYILGAVPIKLKRSVRTRDPFCLVSSAESPNFKVVIGECVFCARRVAVAPSVMMSHNQALQQTTAKYPINRIDCKVVSVPRGNMSGNQPNIFQGILPNRIVIGMVDADAFNDTYTKNPFNFKNYDTTTMGLTVNGENIALHNCIQLHCIASHCIALHCIALHCIALYCKLLNVVLT